MSIVTALLAATNATADVAGLEVQLRERPYIKSIAGYKIEKATIGERAGDQLPLHSDAFETSACLPPTVGQPLRRR